jgi:hypothetical protein
VSNQAKKSQGITTIIAKGKTKTIGTTTNGILTIGIRIGLIMKAHYCAGHSGCLHPRKIATDRHGRAHSVFSAHATARSTSKKEDHLKDRGIHNMTILKREMISEKAN